MDYRRVNKCPVNSEEWFRSASMCSEKENAEYHCLMNEKSDLIEGCFAYKWIESGFCPVLNSGALEIDSQKCRKECQHGAFKSYELRRYPECFDNVRHGTTSGFVTSSVSTLNSTLGESSTSETSYIPAIAISLVVPIVITIIVGIFIYQRRKGHSKRSQQQKEDPFEQMGALHCDEENEKTTLLNMADDTSVQNEERKLKREAFLNSMNATTDELYEDSKSIQKLLDILRKEHRVAFIGERGSGKKTLAMQLAFKLEAEQNELQFKVLHDFHSCEFTPVFSTVIIIPDLFKTWYTHTHVRYIMRRLEVACSLLKQNKCYIIATFIQSTWYSLTEICSQAFDVFPYTFHDIDKLEFAKPIASYIAEKHEKTFSDEFLLYLSKDAFGCIGKPLRALFYFKFLLCKEKKFFLKPLEAIMLDLKLMHDSRHFDYHILLYIMLHNGCVEKGKLLKDTKHILFDDILRNVEDEKCFFQHRVNNLLTTYLVNSIDGKCYRIVHDVIVRCLFIVSVNNGHFDLLLNECDPNLLLDCIRVKTVFEKINRRGELIVDVEALRIGIPTEMFSRMAEAFQKRKDILEVLNIANF